MIGKKQVNLILASNSQARKNLLTNAGIGFEVVAAGIDEAAIRENNDKLGIEPNQTAQDLADAKAKFVSLQNRSVLTLGSDQICHMDGEIFNQAGHVEKLFENLRRLSGKTHILTSALAFALDGDIIFRYKDVAHLTMYELSDAEIDNYIEAAADDVVFAAGGYHIESIGVQLFEKIDGSYFTIMGLPLLAVVDFLKTYEQKA